MDSKFLPNYPRPKGYIDTPAGRLPYFIYGQGRPIFIFNGFTCCQYNLKRIINNLKSKYKIVSLDYIGHGLADNPKDLQHITIQDFIEDSKKVIEATKLDKPILLGYSMGAQLMFEYIRQNPENASGLISLNGTMGRAFDNFFKTDLVSHLLINQHLHPIRELTEFLWKAMTRVPFNIQFFFASFFFLDKKKCKYDDIYPFLNQLKDIDEALLVELANKMHIHNSLPYLEQINQQTLFLAGEWDMFTPLVCSKKAHEKMPNSELVVIPKGTHNTVMERYDFISSQIDKYISNI
jgi:pimeloyl-ACP methyl ester carboxylesterase